MSFHQGGRAGVTAWFVGDDTEEFNNVLSKPRKVHFQSKWKVSQDAVYWVNLGKAQEKGLQFWRDKVSRHYPS